MADDYEAFNRNEVKGSFIRTYISAARQLVRLCCILTLMAGIFATVASSVYRDSIGPGNPWAATSVEFPLSGVTDVVADQKGNIIVGLLKYQRLQVYNDSGVFLYGRFVPTGSGDFRFFIDDLGRLNVASVRGSIVLTFNAQGRVVKQQKDIQRRIFKKCEARNRTFTDNNGSFYSARHLDWDPEIVRTDRAGRQTLSMSTPWYLKPFLSGLPSAITLFGSAWMSWLLRVRKHKQSRTEETESGQAPNRPEQ